MDVRGSRVHTVEVASGTAPTETCSCHVAIKWCTEGEAVASDYCPADKVVEKSAVDYTREGVAAAAHCRDEAYHLAALQSEENRCQVHTQAVVPPDEPDDPSLPTDPEQPVDPSQPEEPVEPAEPETPDESGNAA